MVTSGQCLSFLPAAATTVIASAQFVFSPDASHAIVTVYDNVNCNTTGATVNTFNVANGQCYFKLLPFHNLPVIFTPTWTANAPAPPTTGVSAAAFSAPSIAVALFAVLAALLSLAL